MASPIPEQLRHIYDVVADVPNLAADAVLVHALDKLDQPLRELAVEKLVERANLAGLSPLVANFRRYDDHLQDLVLDRIEALFEATRATMTSDSVEARLGAVHLIRLSGNFRLAYLLSDVLSRRCPNSTEAAMAALLILARGLVRRRKDAASGHDRRALRSDAQHLADAVHRALDSWLAHHRTEVLVAAMLLCDLTEPLLFNKASQTRLHLARALNGTLRGELEPAMAGYALRALRHPDLRDAAAETISTTTDPAFMEELLDAMWITADPENARACGRIHALAWLNDGIGPLQSLPRHRAASALRLIALTGMPQKDKLSICRSLTNISSDDTTWLREAGVWCVTGIDGPAATQMLIGAAASHDPTVASIAATELFRRDPSYTREKVRRLSEPRASARGPEADVDPYCDQYDELGPSQRITAGNRLLAESPDRFHRRIQADFRSDDPRVRDRTLDIVQSLGIAPQYRDQIYKLSHDPDERTRSRAVALLGELDGATAVRILRRSLSDPDPRVQANAVEVLGTRDPQKWRETLTARMNEQGNRAQANAIKALLHIGVRDAAVALLSMLTHESAAHRLSALWVVEQFGLFTLAPRIRRIAADDPDPQVREGAERLLTSSDFAASAPPLETAEAGRDEGGIDD